MRQFVGRFAALAARTFKSPCGADVFAEGGHGGDFAAFG
jgi:hypothetical protein